LISLYSIFRKNARLKIFEKESMSAFVLAGTAMFKEAYDLLDLTAFLW